MTPSQWVLLLHSSLTSLYDHQKRFLHHLPSDGCIDVNKPGWVLVTLEAALGEAVPWSVDHCEGSIMSSGTQPGSSEDPGACALLTARENIVTILVIFLEQYSLGHTMQNRQYLFCPIVKYRSHSWQRCKYLLQWKTEDYFHVFVTWLGFFTTPSLDPRNTYTAPRPSRPP